MDIQEPPHPVPVAVLKTPLSPRQSGSSSGPESGFSSMAASAASAPVRWRWLPVVVVLLSLGLTFALWRHERVAAATLRQAQFNHEVDALVTLLSNRIETYQGLLVALQARFTPTPEIGAETWRSFVAALDLTHRFPAINGIGFVTQVAGDKREAFEARQRQERTGFSIYPTGERVAYYVNTYLEPEAVVGRAVGFDVATLPDRRETAELARDLGRIVATRHQAGNSGPATGRDLIFYSPVYRQDAPLSTLEERRQALLGWTVMGLSASTLLAAPPSLSDAVQFAVFAAPDSASPAALLTDPLPAAADEVAGEPSLAQERHLNTGERVWTVRFQAAPAFGGQKEQSFPLRMALIGLVGSLSLGIVVHVLVSGRRRAEKLAYRMTATLRQSEERLRSVVEGTLQAVLVRRGNTPLMVNRAFAGLFGFATLEEARKGAFLDHLAAPEERDRLLLHLSQPLRPVCAPAQARYTFRALHRDGAEIWVEAQDTGILWDGEPAILTSLLDITLRLQDEARLRTLSQAIESSFIGIMITDTHGLIEYVNPWFCRMSGYSPDEVIGQNPRFLKSGETDPTDYSRMWRAIQAGERWSGEFHNRRKNGELYWDTTVISPIRSPDGAIVNYVAIKEDVTALKVGRARLRQALIEAELANRAKSEFVANMSHELRTPLNAIIGFSGLLREGYFGELNARQNQYVDDIQTSSERLLEIVNDILDLSRLDSQTTEITEQILNLSSILERCLNLHAERALRAHIQLENRLPPRLPCLRGDPVHILKALNNLLSNAIKFTPEGGVVTLSATVSEAPDPEPGLRISIQDTGIGMSEEQIAIALQPFRQVDSGLDRRYEGVGLGLPIARRLVELHGGRLSLRSRPGAGTAVVIFFPVSRLV